MENVRDYLKARFSPSFNLRPGFSFLSRKKKKLPHQSSLIRSIIRKRAW